MKKILLIVIAVLLFGTTTNFAQRPRVRQQHQIERTRYVLVGNGRTDDTAALNAWGKGKKVMYRGRVLGNVLERGKFLITWRIDFNRKGSVIRNNRFIWRYKGYNSIPWVFYGRGVRHYNNKIIDTGIGFDAISTEYLKRELQLARQKLTNLEMQNRQLEQQAEIQRLRNHKIGMRYIYKYLSQY